MRKILNPKILFVILLIVISFTLLFFILPMPFVQAQSNPTPTFTGTIIPQAINSAPTQQQTPTQDTYQQVLEVSKNAVDGMYKTTHVVIIFVGVIFGALTVGGVGGAWLVSTIVRRASNKATIAEQTAAKALNVINNTEKMTTELEKRNGAVVIATSELTQKQSELHGQIEDAKNQLIDLRNDLNMIKSSNEKDRQVIKRPLTLMQIDDHGMQILSGDPEKKDRSIIALIEMSSRPDSIIRRKSVKTLGILEEYDDRVAKRLKEIKDTELCSEEFVKKLKNL